jgi:antitoxin (DNA-binding transcriptional repressor) of toxin-antitoxin stability system
MEKMAISKFKATCLAVIKRVGRTRKPILVTKFGEPIAQVGPPPPKPRPKRWLGDLAHEGRITGDIISPASDESDWEVLKR